jgi:hypothetical protein
MPGESVCLLPLHRTAIGRRHARIARSKRVARREQSNASRDGTGGARRSDRSTFAPENLTTLENLDLSGFDPKAPPPHTDAFFEIVNASRSPEDAQANSRDV